MDRSTRAERILAPMTDRIFYTAARTAYLLFYIFAAIGAALLAR